MDKRYQVFISSTFTDLEGARQEVSQALLQTDCFPAGMELFPAADEEQFEFIKRIIDESDYYVLISAGRYGSIHPETGLSYTEMEYDYAVDTGTPVLRLLHKAPDRLPGTHLERSDEGRRKLEAFRAKVGAGSLVKFWEDPKELGQHVILGLTWLQKHKPAVGWLPVNFLRLQGDEDTLSRDDVQTAFDDIPLRAPMPDGWREGHWPARSICFLALEELLGSGSRSGVFLNLHYKLERLTGLPDFSMCHSSQWNTDFAKEALLLLEERRLIRIEDDVRGDEIRIPPKTREWTLSQRAERGFLALVSSVPPSPVNF
ncbi:DUF4062 domain-containing protein [Rhodovulum sp. DZ06]|uniref:DUF4062 domain-containing protein n=1 Tax=Rhodovulum sp. DZ06 TaxID=3425126 RepID=UPI003D3547D8